MVPKNGTYFPAASSKVNLTLEIALLLPTPDISITFWPEGLTRRMSRSAGKAWERLDSVTVTLIIEPAKPDTAMVEGYGVAVPPVGMVIEPPFPNTLGTTSTPALVSTN